MKKYKKGILLASAIIFALIMAVLYKSHKENDISSYEKDFINYKEYFIKASEYMIRTDGRINISRFRENLYGYSSTYPEERYRPTQLEEEAINFLLFDLKYRSIKSFDGSVMIVKVANNGIERGLLKLNGAELPFFIETTHIQDDWYVFKFTRPFE